MSKWRFSAKRECQILESIDDAGRVTKDELAKKVGLTKPWLGRYLTVLKRDGIVDYNRENYVAYWQLKEIE